MTRARRRSTLVATGLLVMASLTGRAQVPPDVPEPSATNTSSGEDSLPPAPRPVPDLPPIDLSDHAIRKAIADSKALMDGSGSASRSSFGSGTGRRAAYGQEHTDRLFRDAEIPTCLTTDAFRFNPPVIGPFTFTGFAALPFWAQAIGSGGCRF